MSLARGVMFLSVCLLVACSSDPPIKPAALKDFPQTVRAKKLWTNDVRAGKTYNLSPASAEGDIFAADSKGRIMRMDGANGKTKWKMDTKEPISAGVGIGGGLVLVGTAKGKILAFGFDGKTKWSAMVTSEVLAPPAANESWVIVRSGDGKIFGLSAADGVRKWEYQSVLPALILRTEASVSLEQEHVFAGLPGGKVVALRVNDGVQLWEASIAVPRGDNEIERIADVSGEPLRDRSLACVASYQGRVGCFDLAKGAGLWSREASSAQRLAGDDKAVYLVDDHSRVYAYERESGGVLWKQEKLFGRHLTAPLVMGAHLIVADFEGYVHVLNTQDGALEARLRADGDPIIAAPVSTGQSVVVQSSDGDLTAFTLQ
ncbi:MAG: outer membrane protein assembly factor BamB [Betaproteobacteria bacterium]|nr:outer membrane protein assembly factor BamB [Betaproteobacteria bacterium]